MAIIFDGAADPDNVEFTDQNANSTQIEKVIFDNVVVWELVNTIQYRIDSRSGILNDYPVNGWYFGVFGIINPSRKWRFAAFYQIRNYIEIIFDEGAPTLHDLPVAVIYEGVSFPINLQLLEDGRFYSSTSRGYNSAVFNLWTRLEKRDSNIVFEFAF